MNLTQVSVSSYSHKILFPQREYFWVRKFCITLSSSVLGVTFNPRDGHPRFSRSHKWSYLFINPGYQGWTSFWSYSAFAQWRLALGSSRQRTAGNSDSVWPDRAQTHLCWYYWMYMSFLSHMCTFMCVMMSFSVGLCKRSLSPSILGLGWEAQNSHVPNPLDPNHSVSYKSLCVYKVNASHLCNRHWETLFVVAWTWPLVSYFIVYFLDWSSLCFGSFIIALDFLPVRSLILFWPRFLRLYWFFPPLPLPH